MKAELFRIGYLTPFEIAAILVLVMTSMFASFY
jgi:hypothetical protein